MIMLRMNENGEEIADEDKYDEKKQGEEEEEGRM